MTFPMEFSLFCLPTGQITNGSLDFLEVGCAQVQVIFGVSPAGREGQENGNRFIQVFDLALDQRTRLQFLERSIDRLLCDEVEDALVESDHRLHPGCLNRLREFPGGFRCDLLLEKLLTEYGADIFRVIGRESIIGVKDQFKGSLIGDVQANFSQRFGLGVGLL